MKTRFRNLLLAGSMTALTACGGGGGGGGAVGTVSNFVQNDLTNLSGSESIVSSYSSLLSNFNTTISSGDISSIQAILTGPDDNDIAKANTLLTQLSTAESLWAQTEDLIGNQSDADKYTIYNSESYKEAYAAFLYLKNSVKPIIQKVANGRTITLADYNTIAKEEKAQEIITTEKNTTASSYAAEKLIKSTQTITNDTDTSTDATGSSSVSYTDWATVYQGGGDEQRTKTTTTTNLRTTVTTRCTFERTTLLNGTYTDGAQTCTEIASATTELDPTINTETETRTGDNPVVGDPEPLDSVVTTATEESAEYTVTTYTDATDTTTETQEGSATTTTTNRDVTTTTDHGDNTSTVVVTRYVDTTVTTPITTLVYRTRHYTDTVKKDTRTTITTTPVNRITYKDGTTEDVNGIAVVVTGEWSTQTVSESQRSQNILQSETTSEQVSTTSDAGTQISSQLVSNAYTNNDINLGTPTANMSSIVADHKTAEYNSNHGLNTINAADAYARGWTGEGAVLGVIDTWQDTGHEKLDGKYLYYKNYDPYNNTVNEVQSHGTKVASIIAGSRDGDSIDENGRLTTGDYSTTTKYQNGEPYTEYTLSKNNDMHGVAFNSKLVGANVDRFSNGNISKGQAQYALHDFAKLKSPTSEGGEAMNIVAVNMSFNTPQLFYNGWNQNDSTVTQLSDGTYNASEIIAKIQNNGAGDARYWKVATDNDIILVNSAGNKGYAHAGDPGIWAVEEDANGNLILGGKMVIVGTWDGSGVSGNRAGHVCLDINTANNTCNDTHRISDFYILAPGNNIMGADPGNSYSEGSGTSFAAPHVTGAFGVLNQMWPYMKGDNLVKLVMNTADKNLTGYDVNIHGQGLLDLNEATKPQGAVGVPTTGRVDHPVVSLNNTYFSTGTALPSSLENLQIMVLDDYDRNYYMNIGSSFVVQDKRKVSDIDQMKNGYMWMPINQNYGSFAQGGQWDLGYMNFGLFTGESGNGDYSTNIGKKFFISDKFAINGNVGQMKENTTWLGNSSDGVLAVGENNITNFAQIGASYQIGNNVLSLDYNQGSTDINTADNSLVTGFSDVKTESWRLAYEIHKDENNTLGWSFSLPSHITSGNMNMEVAESVNLDGSINYTNINSDLTQKHKEKNIGFFFNHTPTHDTDASFNFTAEYRQDIAGVEGNDGINLGLNYVKKFNGACGFLFWKNPKCFNEDGTKKNMKALYAAQGKEVDNATKHGLVYDMKTDMFVPINSEDEKWKK
jgi:hypothetical protein